MPIRRRRRIARRDAGMTAAERAALLDEELPEGHPESLALFLLRHPDGRALGEAWQRHGDAVTRAWARRYPGTRPSAWWRFTAPEPRQRLGGIGDPAHLHLATVDRLDYGLPSAWITARDRRTWPCIPASAAIDPADPPTFEAEAEYLRRLGLLLPGEAARLTDEDYEAVTITARARDDEAEDG